MGAGSEGGGGVKGCTGPRGHQEMVPALARAVK